MENTNINARFKKIREECGITQTQLAKKLGVSKGTIYYYETGYTAFKIIDTLRNYCKIAGITWDYLLDGKEKDIDFELLSLIEPLSHDQKKALIELIKSIK